MCLNIAGRRKKRKEDFNILRYSEILRAPKSRRGSSKRIISGKIKYILLNSLFLLYFTAIYLLNSAIKLLNKRISPPYYNRANSQAMKAGL
jgi:hypothetical protein